jgi:hypothetical protein
MRPSYSEVQAAARVLHDEGTQHGWWPRHLTYDGLDPIGQSELDGIVERILMAAAAAREPAQGENPN